MIKLFLKTILKYYLKYLTKLVLLIHRPIVIAIAGSTNKTFVKDEIIRVLIDSGFDARSNPRQFNTEIGLPLAILNLPSGYNSYNNWLPVIFKAISSVFRLNFPKYLVLELGVSDAGDMKYLLSIIKPKVGVVTDITQRYLEAFNNMDELAGEYFHFARKIKKTGTLVLNFDNQRVKEIAKISKNKIVSFSLFEGGDWSAKLISRDYNGYKIRVKNPRSGNEFILNRHGDHHIQSFIIGQIVKESVNNYVKN